MRGCVAPLIVSFTLAACGSETPATRSKVRPVAATGSKPLMAPLPRPLTQQSVPWRHLPQPVSDEEFKLDKAKCALAAKMASSTGSPEIKADLVFADCMRSKGYTSIVRGSDSN